jgi:cytochrome c biogenesis factor
MNLHKASMDSFTKALTIVVSVILVLSGFVPIFTSEFQFSNVSTPAPFYVMPFAFIIMLLLTYGFSPKGYSVQDGQLVIYRPFRNKFYETAGIQTVTIVAKEEMKWSMRVFGVGGLFGYFGLFRNSRFGTMIWYASRRDQFVVIERSNGRAIVLTPDDPSSFVSEFNQMIKG